MVDLYVGKQKFGIWGNIYTRLLLDYYIMSRDQYFSYIRDENKS
jgi:hypothetical protein